MGAFTTTPCNPSPVYTNMMHIGTLTIVLYLHDTESLKDKRQILKSLIAIHRQKFNISIAEIEDNDKWRKATLGVACVANDAAHVNRVLDKVIDSIESNPSVEVGDVAFEML